MVVVREHKSLPYIRNGRHEEKTYFFMPVRVIVRWACLLVEDECSVDVYSFGLGEDWTAVCVQQMTPVSVLKKRPR